MDNIDLIIKTFEMQTSKKVYSINKVENVINNRVYKIETASGSYIFKIYAIAEWPENGKLSFVCNKLDEYNIPHAKVLAFNREDENFPTGYLIEECLPGITADRLSLSHEETLKLFEKLGELISRVHQIELTGYGYTGSGIADYTSFSEFMFDVLNDNSQKLISNGFIEDNDLKEVNIKILGKLKHFDMLPSVLCHGDLSTKNIVVNNNKITLIDWDDVQSLCWVTDIARLTFWMRLQYEDHLAAAYRKAFLDNYETKHDKNIFKEIEVTLHVWYGLDYLTFFTKGPICEKAKLLLQDSRNKCGI